MNGEVEKLDHWKHTIQYSDTVDWKQNNNSVLNCWKYTVQCSDTVDWKQNNNRVINNQKYFEKYWWWGVFLERIKYNMVIRSTESSKQKKRFLHCNLWNVLWFFDGVTTNNWEFNWGCWMLFSVATWGQDDKELLFVWSLLTLQ